MSEDIFNESYDRLTPGTPAHAENFNKIFDLLLENDKFLKYAADALAEKMLEKSMVANNLVTDNEGMVLAAPMGKLLKEQLDEQNKNINGNDIMKHLPLNSANLNPFNIDDTKGNWVAGFTETGEGTYFEKYWQNIAQFDTHHFRSQLSIKSFADGNGIPRLGIRSWWGNKWTDWYSFITSRDIQPKFTTIPLNFEVLSGSIQFVKSGNIVQIWCDIRPTNDVGSFTQIGAIPQEYYPYIGFLGGVTEEDTGRTIPIFISKTGEFRTCALGLTGRKFYYGIGTYICK